MNEIAEKVKQLGPWVTKFTILGVDYGGTYDAINDDRVSRVMEFFPQSPRILELGCLEGGHTVVLSRVYPTSQIVALDGRPQNIERARLLTAIAGCKRVSFGVEDLETAELTQYGQFDLCVCMGLLYHLLEPWKLVKRLGEQCEALWIWTTICDESEANVTREHYRGRVYDEGPVEHPLSGLRSESFFPTLGSLVQMLRDGGYVDFHVMNMESTPNGPSVLMACSKRLYRLNL